MAKRLFGILLVVVMLVFGISVTAQDDFIFPIGEGPFSWGEFDRFSELDFGGEEVVFFGPWLRTEAEAVEAIVEYFNAATNANVVYVGSDSFEQQITIDVQGGNPPNLAAFPQPGLAANIASIGGLVPLSDATREYVLENYAAGSSWVDLATYADDMGAENFYAVFYNVNLKSIVWYVPDEFEERGYEIPATWDELLALADQMVADGTSPFCLGIGSQAATGWPATDWSRTSCCVPPRPKPTMRGRPTASLSLIPPSSMPSRPSAWSPVTTPTSTVARRRSSPPTSATARLGCSPPHRSASCTAKRASSPPTSPKMSSLVKMPTSSTSRRSMKRSVVRSWALARWSPSPRTARRLRHSSTSCSARWRTNCGRHKVASSAR